MPVIPAIREAEAGKPKFEASLGNIARPGLKIKKIKRSVNIAQRYNTCLACLRPWLNPQYLKKKRKKRKKEKTS
jgi:hypothetical protein